MRALPCIQCASIVPCTCRPASTTPCFEHASCVTLQISSFYIAIYSQSKLVVAVILLEACNMFAYMVIFGRSLPASWATADTVVVIFFQGDFDMAGLAEIVLPCAQEQIFQVPLYGRKRFHMWQWTGTVPNIYFNVMRQIYLFLTHKIYTCNTIPPLSSLHPRLTTSTRWASQQDGTASIARHTC